MKSQEQREGDAVVIFTAMLGLAATAVIGLVMFEVASAVTGLVDSPLNIFGWVLFWAVLACLASAPLGYLYRHRRP